MGEGVDGAPAPYLQAKGETGQSGSYASGGGAGGTVYFKSEKLLSQIAQLDVSAGNGGSGTNSGGGGGGGRLLVEYCQTSFTLSPTSSGGTGLNPGANGLADQVQVPCNP